jgi:signal transduction histidine kinase
LNARRNSFQGIAENTIPWLILAILLSFSYAKFFLHPYGFDWDSKGNIYLVFVKQPEPTLKVGDRLIQVGSLTWEDFHADLRRTFFAGVKPGEIVPIEVERAGQRITIPWRLPGINHGEVIDQFFSEWFMAYIFWLAGTLSLLVLRPKDERWGLLSAFNFLTAIWISAGSGLSNYHIGYAALILRVVVWLSVPIYLHLHWVFPRPLGKLPPLLVGSAYMGTFAVMIAQWLQLLPQTLYLLGFLIAILGSLILLFVHGFRQPDTRRDLRLLFIAAFFIFISLIGVGVVDLMNSSFRADNLALLSFPLLPVAYLHAAYRRQLGGFEMRVNRLMSIYFFVILLGIFELLLMITSDYLLTFPPGTLTIAVAVSLLTTVACLFGYPVFQDFVERSILGIRLPSQRIQETYSEHITASASLSNLVRILEDELLPSLLVRQFVFFKFEKDKPKVIFSAGISSDQMPSEEDLWKFAGAKESQFLASNFGRPSTWVRWVLPLKVGDEMLGLWLFGRRDPDDTYSQAEVPILRSLADQTAVALSNIIQTERLKVMYEADINRYEQERLRLAHELHDSVLNQMAALLMKDAIPLSPNFQEAYNALIERLRGIVSDLRPPMLHYGLKPAIEELAENLTERGGDTVRFIVKVQTWEGRYSENVERNVYRIVQQACENALQHGKAKQVSIAGVLDGKSIELEVEDDGIGFDNNQSFDLDDMLANKHFGIAGMIERAMLIGGKVRIVSAPNTGTRVQVLWNADHAEL